MTKGRIFLCACSIQITVANLAMRKLGFIETNIFLARRKLAATNMFLLPVCFEVCTYIFLTENKWQQRDVTLL